MRVAIRKLDLFISRASENKDELVRPLATALAAAGVKVWYDEFSLRLRFARFISTIGRVRSDEKGLDR